MPVYKNGGMSKTRKMMVAIASVLFCVVVGLTLYRWIMFGTIDGGGIFYSFIAIAYFFNIITWGDPNGSNEKDELYRQITMKSARISYFGLMILSSVVLWVSSDGWRLHDIDNYPLLIVVGLTFVVLPITEFFYARKFK
jgi:hypothetical protein